MAASSVIKTEKSFRRIMGSEQLGMLESYLDNPAENEVVVLERRAGKLVKQRAAITPSNGNGTYSPGLPF